MHIGGNVDIEFQKKYEIGKNRMGESMIEWSTVIKKSGFLDMMSGNSNYSTYNAKIEESTHVFMCDYFEFNEKVDGLRAVIEGSIYDVKYVDNPLGMNVQLEIYLAKVGG